MSEVVHLATTPAEKSGYKGRAKWIHLLRLACGNPIKAKVVVGGRNLKGRWEMVERKTTRNLDDVNCGKCRRTRLFKKLQAERPT